MMAIADLVERSGELKGQLVMYGQSRRFNQTIRRAIRERYGEVVVSDDGDFTNFLDHFLLQYRLPDKRTIVDHFVAAHPDLPHEEREMLLGWRDVVEGIFEIDRRDSDCLLVVNLIDELTYRVYSNMGPSVFDQMPTEAFLVTRLVPVGEAWLLSGASSIYPADNRRALLEAAAELALEHPQLAFRNPDKLDRAWQLQREDRQNFLDFFGADLVVLPGAQLADRMREYWQYRTYEARDADGTTAADRGRRRFGQALPPPELTLPTDLCESHTVAVIYDDVEGLSFYANFGLVEAAFDDPNLATEPVHRRAVLGYLRDDSVSPVPLRRLAQRHPDRASLVFQRLLKRPKFDWNHEGEALLRKYKASHFDRPGLPRVTPVGGALLEHYSGLRTTGRRRNNSGSKRGGARPKAGRRTS